MKQLSFYCKCVGCNTLSFFCFLPTLSSNFNKTYPKIDLLKGRIDGWIM